MYGLKVKAERASVALVGVLLFLTSFFSMYSTAHAAQLTARKLTLGSSVQSANTSYQFDFTTGTTATIIGFEAQICTTASGTCTTPSGFSVSVPGSTLTSTTLSGTWTVSNATAGSLRASATGASSTTASAAKQIIFGNVHNPSDTNTTFFARITLYSGASWTTAVDAGTVAASTAGVVTVTASVDETLTFTLADTTVALGTLTPSTTGSGTSTMSASTNSTSGYAITVNGTTLTAGANTIAALASNAASSQGTSQFGINLMANATPSVGTAVSGTGSGTPAANYNTANSFRFATGETVASATAATNSNTYTVSYIANVGGAQQPGSYQTALTYIATANF